MKFVHIADMHFDSPFVNLSEKDIMGDLRRLEQRKVFKKIIEYIKEKNIKYFFISGDLYEHKYIKQSTIEYINKLSLSEKILDVVDKSSFKRMYLLVGKYLCVYGENPRENLELYNVGGDSNE